MGRKQIFVTMSGVGTRALLGWVGAKTREAVGLTAPLLEKFAINFKIKISKICTSFFAHWHIDHVCQVL